MQHKREREGERWVIYLHLYGKLYANKFTCWTFFTLDYKIGRKLHAMNIIKIRNCKYIILTSTQYISSYGNEYDDLW